MLENLNVQSVSLVLNIAEQVNALSQNGAWMEATGSSFAGDDFFSDDGRVELERLARRNREMHAWASHPSSIDHALWPEAPSLVLRTGPPSLVFECLVSPCDIFSPEG